jgi:acetolactate decarboxylase
MFHEGQIGATVTLDSMLPDPDLYAIGALAGLAGEVTIVGGRAYLSCPDGDATRTETPSPTNAAATLLVAARVPAWRSFPIERPNGSRLAAGGASHQDHMGAAVKATRDRAAATTLVGFFSQGDQGVFTHMGSKTHIHCVLEEPLATGHVDRVVIPAGASVKFPAGLH